jgi:hypothetical protein
MSRDLIFRFEELPLVVDLGVEAGLVNGHAVICYWPTGEWGITSIMLDGYRERSEAERAADQAQGKKLIPRFEHKAVPLEGNPLYTMIWSRLEDEWRDSVQDAVRAALEQERAA